MLPETEWIAYQASLEPAQVACVSAVRQWISNAGLNLTEAVETGKWWTGLLVYSSAEKVPVFALGPLSGGYTTLHMMPFYGSSELQARHGAALKKLLSGKSCIKFKSVADLPEEAIKDIIASTPKFVEIALAMNRGKKKASV